MLMVRLLEIIAKQTCNDKIDAIDSSLLTVASQEAVGILWGTKNTIEDQIVRAFTTNAMQHTYDSLSDEDVVL